MFKVLYISLFLYMFSALCTKISIILLYLRTCQHDPLPKRLCYGLVVFISAHTIVTGAVGLRNCTPIARFWDRTIPGTCLNSNPVYITNATIYVATDLALVLLPILMLKDLTVPMAQKISIVVLLSLGGLACVAGAVRIYYLHRLDKTQDITWESPNPAVWSLIEICVGIICASVSTLRPLLGGFNMGTTNKLSNESREQRCFSGLELQSDGKESRKPSEGANSIFV